MTEEAEETADEPENKRPIQEFRGSGGIKVAVWKKKFEDGPDRYSILIDRVYRDSGGEFRSTKYLDDRDLLRTAALLQEADNWIEKDKRRQRGTGATER
jgi:hypothetical protein